MPAACRTAFDVGSNSKSAFTKSRRWVQSYLAANAASAEVSPSSQQAAHDPACMHKSGSWARILIRVIPQITFWKSWPSMEEPGERLSVNLRRDASHRSRSQPLPCGCALPPAPFRRIHYTEAAGRGGLPHDFCRSCQWTRGETDHLTRLVLGTIQ